MHTLYKLTLLKQDLFFYESGRFRFNFLSFFKTPKADCKKMLRSFKTLFEFPDLQMETKQNILHSPEMTIRITSSTALLHKI